MKWVSTETKESKFIRLSDWHVWFAWFPVTVKTTVKKDGKTYRVKVWLDKVERRGIRRTDYEGGGFWIWEYNKLD